MLDFIFSLFNTDKTPKYVPIEIGVRKVIKTGEFQGYCSELVGWYPLDYLQGTNYDEMYWCRYQLPEKAFY